MKIPEFDKKRENFDFSNVNKYPVFLPGHPPSAKSGNTLKPPYKQCFLKLLEEPCVVVKLRRRHAKESCISASTYMIFDLLMQNLTFSILFTSFPVPRWGEVAPT